MKQNVNLILIFVNYFAYFVSGIKCDEQKMESSDCFNIAKLKTVE